MIRSLDYRAVAFLLWGAAMAMASSSASAAFIGRLDSSDFDYLYEMDAALGTLDLDGNTTADWFNGNAGTPPITQPTVSGGFGNSNQTAAPSEILWRTDFGGSLTRGTVNNAFTIEVSVQLVAGTQDVDDVGTFGLALQQPAQGQSLRLNIGESGVNFNNGGINAIATGDNTDAQHVFRIAYDNGDGTNGGADDGYTIWRDGSRLAIGQGLPFVGSNGSFNSNGAWFLGDFSGTLSGEWIVDYVRATPGAYAPVPEPAGLGLLALATLFIGLRYRV